jgi:hypothetical protein
MFEPEFWSVFRQSHRFLEAEEGPNDGLVSVESSKWGGEASYKGTLVGVSHLDLINWTNRLKWLAAELTGQPRKYAFPVVSCLGRLLIPVQFTEQIQRRGILSGHSGYVIPGDAAVPGWTDTSLQICSPKRAYDNCRLALSSLSASLQRYVWHLIDGSRPASVHVQKAPEVRKIPSHPASVTPQWFGYSTGLANTTGMPEVQVITTAKDNTGV